MATSSEELSGCIFESYVASLHLAQLTAEEKSSLVKDVAYALKHHSLDILESNTLDLEASREMSIPELITDWLKLTPDRLQTAIDCLFQLADLASPLSNRSSPSGFKRLPIGTVALVYEAIPELSIIAAGMCLKVGNALVLKGGSEVTHTQQTIVSILQEVLERHHGPITSLTIVPKGSPMKDLLTQEKYLRLVIPYGRPSYVQQILKQCTVSVLPTAMGNCYLYVSPTGNLKKALEVISQSRHQQPDPVSAIEKVLLHRSWLNSKHFPQFLWQLHEQQLSIRGCESTRSFCRELGEPFESLVAAESQWGQSYLDQTVALRVIDSLEAAISWINLYSSGHCDVILTDSLRESQLFANQVNSSIVYINHFTPFARSHQDTYFSVALGMTTLKGRGGSRHPGLIDLEALTMTKRIFVD